MRAIDRLKAAYAAKARGEYQTALEHLVWFHEYALDETRALLGIRLSYALAYWIELGAEFPPALDALRQIRDRKVADLRAGRYDGQLFLDVSAINDYLSEGAGTYLLYVELRHRAAPFAAECAPIALPAVVDAQELGRRLGSLYDSQNDDEEEEEEEAEGEEELSPFIILERSCFCVAAEEPQLSLLRILD